jgi:hypothetical protein
LKAGPDGPSGQQIPAPLPGKPSVKDWPFFQRLHFGVLLMMSFPTEDSQMQGRGIGALEPTSRAAITSTSGRPRPIYRRRAKLGETCRLPHVIVTNAMDCPESVLHGGLNLNKNEKFFS